MVLAFSPAPSPSPDDGGLVPDEAVTWIVDASGTLLTVGFILLGAMILWVIGQLVIRGIVRGISRGSDWGREQAKDVLVKVRLSAAEETAVERRLADERRANRASTIGSVLRAALNVVVVTIALLMILAEVGVNVGPVLASAGIVGVALGFGAQSLVKDLLSGMFMLIEDQYGVGDVIDVGEASGFVEEVGLRVTKLRGLDGTAWYIPNGEITRVGNMTQTWSRVLIEVRFAYDTDIPAAKQAMLDAVELARQNESIAAAMVGDPDVAGVETLEFNAVMLRLLQQVKPITQWDVMREVRQHMRDLFVERGIRLAAPEGALIQSDGPAARRPAGRRRPSTPPPRATEEP